MKHSRILELGIVAIAILLSSVPAKAGTATVSLPSSWRSGERIEKTSDGAWTRISAPRLFAPDSPLAVPQLPFAVVPVDAPAGASNLTITVEAEWDAPVTLDATVIPVAEPVPYPQPVVIPEPDADAYAGVYPSTPAVIGGKAYVNGAWRRNIIITPYRVSNNGLSLERAKSVVVKVEWTAAAVKIDRRTRLLATTTQTPRYAIVSPPAFKDLWGDYIEFRKTTHPDIDIFVKNTSDIYAEFPEAVAAGDYKLAIHKFLEAEYSTNNLQIVLLGAAVPGLVSGEAFNTMEALAEKMLPFDSETQVPTCYPALSSGTICEPTDLYYACLDKLGGEEVWDSDGDHVYMGTTNTFGGKIERETNKDTIDFYPELQVMRLAVLPMAVEISGDEKSEYTAAQQIANWVNKMKIVEGQGGRAWTGEGNNAILGASYYMNPNDKNSKSEYLRNEREFFDGGVNMFAPEHTMNVVDNEWEVRTRNWQFFSGLRANNLTRMHVGAFFDVPDPYGADYGAVEALTNSAGSSAVVYAEDYDAALVQSHGWARGADPIWSAGLMLGKITGVTRVLFCPDPCDSGWFDFTSTDSAYRGQTITNACCVGAAACLAPGGFIASYNNSRHGWWGGFGNIYSSLLESYLLEAHYYGEATHDFKFDPENNDAALKPVTAGEALLKMREVMGSWGGSGLYGNYNGKCVIELTGFGDPLVAISPQTDATNDFSKTVYRVLTLTTNPTISATNSAARLVFEDGVTKVDTSGKGILRATVDAQIAESELEWSVAGGVGRCVIFASAGGKLSLPGTAKCYFGRTFTNVNEIAVSGANVTLDFGFNRENETLPVSSLSFNSETGGTNILRNARTSISTAFTSTPIPVSNSTLRCELTSAVPFDLTDATLLVATNPMWQAIYWNKTLTMNESRLVVGVPEFSLDSATISAVGGSNTVESLCGVPLAATGDLNISLSNGATLDLTNPIANTNGANSRLVVSGSGTIALNALPLSGFTNVTIGAGVTLALLSFDGEYIRILSGGASASLAIDSGATVTVDGTEIPYGTYALVSGYFYKDGSTVKTPPYSRTLSTAAESWFNSSAWYDTDNNAFGTTWANAATIQGAVNLNVGSYEYYVPSISLSVEKDLDLLSMTIASSLSYEPSPLTITAADGVGILMNSIDAASFTPVLTLDFDLSDELRPLSLSAGSDTRVTGLGGYGTLTIASGMKATINHGWFGAMSNSGTLVCQGTDPDEWTGIKLPAGGTINVSAPIAMSGDYAFSSKFNAIGENCDFSAKTFTITQDAYLTLTDGAKMTVTNFAFGGNQSYSTVTMSGGSELIVTKQLSPGCLYNPWAGQKQNGNVWQISGTGTVVKAHTVYNGTTWPSWPFRMAFSDGAKFVIGAGGVKGLAPTTCYLFTSSGGIIAADADWTVGALTNMPIVISSAKTHTFDPAGHTITFPCTISGSGTLVVTNSAATIGKLVLTGTNNTWTGGTTLLGGTTKIATAKSLGTGTLKIGDGAVLDIGTNRLTNITIDSSSTGRIVFTLTAEEYDNYSVYGNGIALCKVTGDAPALDYFCMDLGGGVYTGSFSKNSSGYLVFSTTVSPYSTPITATVSGEMNWSELTWVDSSYQTVNLTAAQLAAFDELYLVAAEDDAKVVLDTSVLPPTIGVGGANRLQIDTGDMDEDLLPKLDVMEGATVEFFEEVLFPSDKLVNGGAVRIMSETNLAFTVESMVDGTNRFENGYFVGTETHTGTKVLAVGDGDNVIMLENDSFQNRHRMGFNVSGGILTFSNPENAVWFADMANSKPFVQTGGETTFHLHDSVATDVNNANRGVVLGWTGTGDWEVSVLGGLFSSQNAPINFWQTATTFTVADTGVAKLKGVVAHSDVADNALVVRDGGTLELGAVGIAASNITATVVGGTVRATTNATICAAMSVTNATLAAADGTMLTVGVEFASVGGELTLGADGYAGTVNLGPNRPATNGLTLADGSQGTVGFVLSDEELDSDAVVICPSSAIPESLTVVCTSSDGTVQNGSIAVVGGNIVFTPKATLPDVAFTYFPTPEAPGSPAGWSTSFSQALSTNYRRVSPFETGSDYILEVKTDSLLPHSNMAAKSAAFTFAVYADIDAMPSENRGIIAAFGKKGAGKVVLYREGEYVGLTFDTNRVQVGTAAVVPRVAGYHLYTAVVDPTAGTLGLSVDGAAPVSGGAEEAITLSNGFQIGSVYEGRYSPYVAGTGIALAAVVGWDSALTDKQIAILTETYPPKTNALYFSSYDIPEGATLTLDPNEEDATISATSVTGTGTICGDTGATGTLTLDIPEGVSVGVDGKLVLSGSGTAVAPAGTPPATVDATQSGWTGTYAISSIATNNFDFAALANSGSKVQLTGISGYPKKANFTNDFEIVLVDSTNGTAALTVNNGYSDYSYCIAKLSGDGTFAHTRSGVTQGYNILDGSDFTGTFNLVGGNITFGGKIRHKNYNAGSSGSLFLDPDGCLGLTTNSEWSASGGITINGPVNINTDGATLVGGMVVLTNKTGSLSVEDGASVLVDGAANDRWSVEKAGNSLVLVDGGTTLDIGADEGGETIVVSPSTVAALVATGGVDAATLNTVAANGLRVWQNVVLGITASGDETAEELKLEISMNGSTPVVTTSAGSLTAISVTNPSVVMTVGGITATATLQQSDYLPPEWTTADSTSATTRFYRISIDFTSSD